MARQARSEATRRKILDAAVELFNDAGYASTGLGDIIERAELTKGALYYHFDSKEALATAVIEDATATVFQAVGGLRSSGAPAMENLIHLSFVVGDLIVDDAIVRTGSALMRTLGEFSDVAVHTYLTLGELICALARAASDEGDLRAGVDPDAAGELFVSAYLGIELLSIGNAAGQDMTARLTRGWSVLLPAIAAEEALPYFVEFVNRESDLRRRHHTP